MSKKKPGKNPKQKTIKTYFLTIEYKLKVNFNKFR